MSKKSISIMVVPHTNARIYNFHLPLFLIYTVSFSLLVLLIAFFLLVIDYRQIKREVTMLAPMNKQLIFKNNQLETAQGYQSQEIQKLNKIMKNLEKFEEKLRIMTGLEVKEEKLNENGKGGPETITDDTDWAKLKYELAKNVTAVEEEKHLSSIKKLQEKALLHQQGLSELEDYLTSQQNLSACTPSIWPMQGWIKQGFGSFVSPFTGCREEHNGLDMIARQGTPITAAADGRVVFSGKDGELGLKVVIDHGYGYQTTYAHNYVNKVKTGSWVKRGQIIATCGSSGRSSGPHLFYAVKVKGKYLDPTKYMLN